MAAVQIRHYEDNDEMHVKDIFILGMKEHIPYSCLYVLKQTHIQLFLLFVFCALLASSKSILLPILAVTLLLAAGRLGVGYIVHSYIEMAMHTDLRNIRQTYFEQHNSCFWVAEKQGQVVGMVACLPKKLDKGCLELKRMSVKHSHRRQGIAKALCHTVANFAWEQGFSAVVLQTSIVQIDAHKLYECLGYKKVGEFTSPKMFSWITKFVAIKYMLNIQQPGN